MRPKLKYRVGVVAAIVAITLLCWPLRPKPETPQERVDRLSREFIDQHREQNRKPQEMWKQ
jgi:hypothetical protein